MRSRKGAVCRAGARVGRRFLASLVNGLCWKEATVLCRARPVALIIESGSPRSAQGFARAVIVSPRAFNAGRRAASGLPAPGRTGKGAAGRGSATDGNDTRTQRPRGTLGLAPLARRCGGRTLPPVAFSYAFPQRSSLPRGGAGYRGWRRCRAATSRTPHNNTTAQSPRR